MVIGLGCILESFAALEKCLCLSLTPRDADLLDLGCIHALGFLKALRQNSSSVGMLKDPKVRALMVAAIFQMDKIRILLSYKVIEEQWTQRSHNELNPRE